ncbi:MAG: YfhO family protein [Armatimonadetes bacterium]|nr:YfhO family protein [Armatimonadota bacterium]
MRSVPTPRKVLIAALLAIGLPLLFMGPTLLVGRPLIRDDAAVEFYPEFERYARCLQGNNLYLWDPAQWCGLPTLATAESGGLYPVHLLAFRWLPWQIAVHVCYWLHLSLAVLAFLWVAGNLGIARRPALVGATVYAFSGFAAAHLIHYYFITGQAHLVLLLAVLQTALVRRSWRWWGILGLELAMAFLCVQPQLLLMALLVSFLWLVSGGWWRERSAEGRRRWVGVAWGLAVAGVTAALLVSPQLLAELELSRLAGVVSGGGQDALSFIRSYSFRAVDLPRLVFPNLYGTIRDSATGAGPVFHETSSFVGVAVLMLGAAGLVLARRQKGYLFLALALLAGIALVPSGNPVYRLVAQVPVLNGFRAMGRWVLVPTFSLAMLASFGLALLPQADRRVVGLARAVAGAVAGAVLLPLALLWVTFGLEPGATAVPGSGAQLPPENLGRVIYNWLVGWEPILVLVAAGLTLGVFYAVRRRSLCLALALLATGVPLWHYWQSVNQPGPRDYYIHAPQTAAAIQQRGGGRLTTLPPDIVCTSDAWRARPPAAAPEEVARELLSPVYGLVFGLSYGDGYRHRLTTPATYRLWQQYYRYGAQAFTGVVETTAETIQRVGTPVERMKRMHRLCGIQYLVTPGTISDPDLAVAHEGPVRVYEYRTHHPEAWLVGRSRTVRDPDQQLETIKLRTFDPETEAVVDGEVVGLSGGGGTGAATMQRRFNETTVATRATAPALLVISQAWYPGWTACVDGQRAPLLRANYAFCAVPVPTGEHTVTLRYEPTHWRLCLGLLALGVLLLVVLLKTYRPDQIYADANHFLRL